MRKKKIVRYIQIGLHQREADVIKKIEDEGREVTTIIRSLIEQYGERYNEKPTIAEIEKEKLEMKKRTQEEQEAWDKLSPEDYAVNTLRGRIKDGQVWFMVQGSDYPVDMDEVKEYTLKSPLIKNHIAILEGRYVWDGGTYTRPWTKEEHEARIKKWIEHTS